MHNSLDPSSSPYDPRFIVNLDSGNRENILQIKVRRSALDLRTNIDPQKDSQPENKSWIGGLFSWFGVSVKIGEKLEDSDNEITDNSENNEDISFPEFPFPIELDTEDDLKPMEKTVIKAYRAAQKSSFSQSIQNLLLWVGGAYAIKKYATTYDRFDKGSVIAQQKQRMVDELGDPQYVEFYEVISAGLLSVIKGEVLDAYAKQSDSISQIIASREDLILKLLEVILARGFGHLASLVKVNQASIPNFDRQPSLASVISLLSQDAGRHVSQEQLKEIEEKYRVDQLELQVSINKLFPEIRENSEDDRSLQLYIHDYIHSNDVNRKNTIKKDLFPDLAKARGQHLIDIEYFFAKLDRLHLKNQEFKLLFGKISESILLCLFPNKFSDIDELKGSVIYFMGDNLFEMIKGSITDVLQGSYEPLENSLIRNQKWTKDLEDRLGVPDLDTIIEAPSALLVAFAKNYIQSDPTVMEDAEEILDNFFNLPAATTVKHHLNRLMVYVSESEKLPTTENAARADKAILNDLKKEVDKVGRKDQNLTTLRTKKQALERLQSRSTRSHIQELTEEVDALIEVLEDQVKQRKNVLNQLSQRELAGWLVETVHILLNGKDPQISGLAAFGKQATWNLTLALMAKGAKFLIPEGEVVDPNDFIKRLSERLIEKIAIFQGEEIVSEKFLTDFVNDLPLPPFVKGMILPLLIKKFESLHKTAKEKNREFQEIKDIYRQAYDQVATYRRGEELLSITHQMGEEIVKKILEKNIDLVTHLGFGDSIEELFVHYLPGITINEELKSWFKKNISSLGGGQSDASPESIELLKQGVQAVLLKAISNTIEKNFRGDSEDYAAQLIGNVRSAFFNAFLYFDEGQTAQLKEAAVVQNLIEAKNKQIETIKNRMSLPLNIDQVQVSLLEGAIAAHRRVDRASDYIENLEQKRDALLVTLNHRQRDRVWTADDLNHIEDALFLLKREKKPSEFSESSEEFLRKLKENIDSLKMEDEGVNPGFIFNHSKKIQNLELLQILMKMNPSLLKLISEASNIQATLCRAENEKTHLQAELNEKQEALDAFIPENFENREVWNAAKDWKNSVVQGKIEIKRLNREIADLELDLDDNLSVFPDLSKQLTSLLGWESKEDLELPPFVQDQVWPLIESMQEKQIARLLFKELSPVILCWAERNQDRETLRDLSGSDFMGSLCEALSKDLFSFALNAVQRSPAEMAGLVSRLVPDLDPDLREILANEIEKFIREDSESYHNGSNLVGPFLEGILLKFFIRVSQRNPRQIGDHADTPSKDSIVVLTEKLLDIATEKYREAREDNDFTHLSEDLNQAIMVDLLGIDSPLAFEGLSERLQIIVFEGIRNQLGEFIVRIQEGLSTIGSDNARVMQVKEDVKKIGIENNVNKALLQVFAEDLAGVAVASVPHVLTQISGESMKGVVQISKGLETYLEDLARGNVEIAKVLLGYAKTDQFKNILKDDLRSIADQEHFVADKKKVVDLVGNLILESLGLVMEKSIQFESKHKESFTRTLMVKILGIAADHLKHINDAKNIAMREGRKNILHKDFIEAVGDQLHPAVPKESVTYGKTLAAIEARLSPNLNPLQQQQWVAGEEKVRQLISKTCKQEYISTRVIDLNQFVNEFKAIYQEVIGVALTEDQENALKNIDEEGLNLRDIMRQELRALEIQRNHEAYGPATLVVLNMMFPKGEEDLTFVPAELRSTVWNQFKTNLFPLLLPMLTELILDPPMINSIILSSLQTMNDTLSEKINPNVSAEDPNLPLDELDQVSGELIAQALRSTTLPGWIKKMLIDPKTGEITDAMKKSLGSTLRSQFNETFIKNSLERLLKNFVRRDENGHPVLSYNSQSKQVKDDAAVKAAKQMEKDIKAAFRKTVNVSISYAIRSRWVAAQVRFDKLVKEVFGNVGAKVKKDLDLLFGFVFFKIIGTLLDWLTYPIRQVAQEIIYEYIFGLDDNRKRLIGLLTGVPADQPESESKSHGVYNEDLIFKMGEALAKVVKDFLDNEPIVPVEHPIPV